MPWYVLTTPPQRELDAIDELARKGVEAWAPREWVEQRQRRHDHHAAPLYKARPYLNRYVLVNVAKPTDVSDILYAMSRTFRPTVTGYLGAYGMPIAVPEMALAALKAIDGRHRSTAVQRHKLIKGQIIHIGGRPATITKARGNRATVMQEWFGSQREVTINASSNLVAAE